MRSLETFNKAVLALHSRSSMSIDELDEQQVEERLRAP